MKGLGKMPRNVTSNTSILCRSVILCPGSAIFSIGTVVQLPVSLSSWQEAAWWGGQNVASGASDPSLDPVTPSPGRLGTSWQLALPRQSSSFLTCKKRMITHISASLGVNMYQAFALVPGFQLFWDVIHIPEGLSFWNTTQFLVYPQSCALITTLWFRNMFLTPRKKSQTH